MQKMKKFDNVNNFCSRENSEKATQLLIFSGITPAKDCSKNGPSVNNQSVIYSQKTAFANRYRGCGRGF